MKKSIVQNHLSSTKHTSGKERLKAKEKRQSDIASILKNHDKEIHPVGEKLSEEVRVYRYKVVTAFLKAGVPLAKIDCFRELLEEGAYSLSGSQHLGDLIPCVHNEEKEKIKSAIASRQVSVIFDGTTKFVKLW